MGKIFSFQCDAIVLFCDRSGNTAPMWPFLGGGAPLCGSRFSSNDHYSSDLFINFFWHSFKYLWSYFSTNSNLMISWSFASAYCWIFGNWEIRFCFYFKKHFLFFLIKKEALSFLARLSATIQRENCNFDFLLVDYSSAIVQFRHLW